MVPPSRSNPLGLAPLGSLWGLQQVAESLEEPDRLVAVVAGDLVDRLGHESWHLGTPKAVVAALLEVAQLLAGEAAGRDAFGGDEHLMAEHIHPLQGAAVLAALQDLLLGLRVTTT